MTNGKPLLASGVRIWPQVSAFAWPLPLLPGEPFHVLYAWRETVVRRRRAFPGGASGVVDPFSRIPAAPAGDPYRAGPLQSTPAVAAADYVAALPAAKRSTTGAPSRRKRQ